MKALLVFNEVFWDPGKDYIIPLPNNETDALGKRSDSVAFVEFCRLLELDCFTENISLLKSFFYRFLL